MSVLMTTPTVHELGGVVDVLRGWQHDGGPMHLHPGDVGWHSMKGAAATAAALRTWSRAGTALAVGLLDGPELLRLAVDPGLRDDEVAHAIAADLDDPARGVLGEGTAAVEARGARRVSERLAEYGWLPDELWTPFHRDLSAPVREVGVRVETVDPGSADGWLAVHWSAFRGTPSTQEERRPFVDRWRDMAGGPAYAEARSLVARDAHGDAVAAATVWSAGPGRPGLLEPLGVHRDHRGRGHGTAMALAAAAALRELGSSSAIVCAESSNVGAVSTYAAAGFTAHDEVADLRRSDRPPLAERPGEL